MARKTPAFVAAHPLAGGLVVRWRSVPLWWSVAAHVAIILLLTLIDWLGGRSDPSTTGVVLSAGAVLIPVTAAVAVSAPRQADAGGALLASASLLTLVMALGAAEIPLALASDSALASVGAVSCLFGAAGFLLVFVAVGTSLRYAANLPAGSFRVGRCALPGVYFSVLLVIASTELAPEERIGRRLGAVVAALSGAGGVQSQAWLWAGRAGVILCASSIAVLALTEQRRRRLLSDPARRPSRVGRSRQ